MKSRSGSTAASRGTYLLSLPWDVDAIGGVTQVVLGLYDELSYEGRIKPRLLIPSWSDLKPVEGVDADGRDIVRCRVRAPSGRGSLFSDLLRYALALPGELLRLRALTRRYAVEVVNCHYIGSTEFTWMLAKSLGIYRGRVVLSLHGLDIRNLAKLRGGRRALWRWTLRHADAIVACSEGLAGETRLEFDLPDSKVVTIHNGVDAGQLEATIASAPREGARRGGPTLINLATFEHKKGHDVLLHALRKVVERRPDVTLTMMGRRAESTDATLRLIEELGLQQHATLQIDAPHSVALRALKDADIFVLSSRHEAFSVALLEAGALGVPVVATDVCGVAELIEDGVTGLLVPSEDAQALAAAILLLLDDPAAAALYGRRLRDRVRGRFTLAENATNYLRLVDELPR